MQSLFKYYFCLYLISFSIIACSKEEGKGGLATIKGKIIAFDINGNGEVKGKAYIGDKDVFISYGDHTYIDDGTKTSSFGAFAFEGLTPGTYTLTVYSQCNECLFNQEAIVTKVTLTEDQQILELPDIEIYD